MQTGINIMYAYKILLLIKKKKKHQTAWYHYSTYSFDHRQIKIAKVKFIILVTLIIKKNCNYITAAATLNSFFFFFSCRSTCIIDDGARNVDRFRARRADHLHVFYWVFLGQFNSCDQILEL